MATPSQNTVQYILSVQDDGSVALAKFAGGLTKTDKEANKLSGGLSKLQGSLVTLGAGLVAYRELTNLARSAMEKWILPTVNQAEHLLTLSRRIGGTVEDMAKLKTIGAAIGTSAEGLAYGFRQMGLALSQINKPGNQARSVLKEVGIEGKKLQELLKAGPVQQLEILATAFEKFEDNAQRQRRLSIFSGRGSQAFNQYINAGIGDRRQLLDFEKRFGLPTNREQAEWADNFLTNLKKIPIAYEGFLNRVFSADVLKRLGNAIQQRAEALGAFFQSIPESKLKSLQETVVRLAEAWADMTITLAKLGTTNTAKAFLDGLASVLERIAKALQDIRERPISETLLKAAGGLDPTAVAVGAATFLGGKKLGLSPTTRAVTALAAGGLTAAGNEDQSSAARGMVAAIVGAIAGGITTYFAGPGFGYAVGSAVTAAISSDVVSSAVIEGFKTLWDNIWSWIKEQPYVLAFGSDYSRDTVSRRKSIPDAPRTPLGPVTDANNPFQYPSMEDWIKEQGRHVRAAARKGRGFGASIGAALRETPENEGGPKPSLGDMPDAAALDQFQRQLDDLKATWAAGTDIAKQFDVQINNQVRSMLYGKIGAEGFADALRKGLVGKEIQDAMTQLAQQQKQLSNAIVASIDPGLQLAAKFADLDEQYRKFTESATATAEQIELVNQVITRQKQLLSDQVVADAVNYQRDLRQQIEAAVDPSTQYAHELENMLLAARKYKEVGLNFDDQIKQLVELKRTAGAFVDIFGAIQKGFDDVVSGLVSGTLDMKKAFESLKISIIKSFADAFAEGFKKKLGFEAAFKVNIVQFLSNIGGLISGQGGGANGQGFGGVVSSLFQNVIASSLGGGVVPYGGGGANTASTGGSTGQGVLSAATSLIGQNVLSPSTITEGSTGVIRLGNGAVLTPIQQGGGVGVSNFAASQSNNAVNTLSFTQQLGSTFTGGTQAQQTSWLGRLGSWLTRGGDAGANIGTISNLGAQLPTGAAPGGLSSFSTFGAGDLLSQYVLGGSNAGVGSAGALAGTGAQWVLPGAISSAGSGATAGLPIVTSNLAQFGLGNGVALTSQFGGVGGVGGTFLAGPTGAVEIAGVLPSFAPTEALVAAGPSGATQGAGAAASGLSGALAVIGLLISLGLAGKGIADSRSSYDKATLGTANGKNNLLTGVQSGIVAGFTAGGAAIGTAAYPGIGTIIGAGVGAAVGSALNSALTSSITTGIGKGLGKGQDTFETGITQKAVNQSVQDKLAGNATLDLISGILNPINLLIRMLAPSASLEGIVGSFATPNVELIISKLFRNAIGEGGGGLNTEGIDQLGKGARAVAREGGELSAGNLQRATRIIGLLAAAGNDPELNRIGRLREILGAGVGRKAFKQGREFDDVLFETFRNVFRNDLVEVMKTLRNEFRNEPTDKFQKDRAFVSEAFQKSLPGADVDRIIDVLSDPEGNFFQKKSRRKSRKAVAGILEDLTADSVTPGAAKRDFTRGIGEAFTQQYDKQINSLFVQQTFGNLLADAFTLSKKARKKIKKQGFTPEVQEEIVEDFSKGAERLAEFMSAGSGFFDEWRKAMDLGFKFNIDLLKATGDFAGAVDLIEQRLQPFADTIKGFQDIRNDTTARVAVLNAGSDPEARFQAEQEQRLKNAWRAAVRFNSFVANFGGPAQEYLNKNPTVTAGSDYRVVQTQRADYPNQGLLQYFLRQRGGTNNWQDGWGKGLSTQQKDALLERGSARDALDTLKDYQDAMLQVFEAQYQHAKELESLWKNIGSQAEGLNDSVRLQTRGGRYMVDILNRDYAKLQTLVKNAGDDPEKQQEALSLADKVFGELGQVYLPGSSKYGQIAGFIDNYTSGVNRDALSKEAKAREDAKTAQDAATAFQDTLLPTIGTFEDLADYEFIQQKQLLSNLLGKDSVLVAAVNNLAANFDTDPNTFTQTPQALLSGIPDPEPGSLGAGGGDDSARYPGIVPEGGSLYNNDRPVGHRDQSIYAYTLNGSTYAALTDEEHNVTGRVAIGEGWNKLYRGTWAKLLNDGTLKLWYGSNPPDNPAPAGADNPKGVDGDYGPDLDAPTARAMGGDAYALRPYLVGEQGPELFIPETNGRVMRADQTSAMLSGGNIDLGDIMVQMATMSPDQIADAIEYLIHTKQRPRLIAALKDAISTLR
jgi:hypothetical protein